MGLTDSWCRSYLLVLAADLPGMAGAFATGRATPAIGAPGVGSGGGYIRNWNSDGLWTRLRLVKAGLAETASLGTQDHWAQIARDGLLFALFAVLAIAGLMYRSSPDIHKRLILLASVVLTTPGLARLSQFNLLQTLPEPLGFLGLFALLLALPAARDRFVDGRIHPTLKWGIPLTFASVFLLLLLPEVF